MKGYAGGRLLSIDLTARSISVETIPEATLRAFIGGRGLGAKLLYDKLPAGVDPLSPQNIILFLTGPATGTLVPNGGKYVVVTKSPLTGAILDTYSSGFLAAELKHAGYDALLITGRAATPTYIYINDANVELRDAGHLWGKSAFAAEDMLKEELGGEEFGLAVIGVAGEKLVKIAGINSEYYRQAARGGGGAVLGSKNLKAIAVRGTGGISLADPQGILNHLTGDLVRIANSQVGQARIKYGTPLTLNITNEAGMLPTRNFQSGVFPEANGFIDAQGVEAATVADRGCYGCVVACSKVTRVDDGPYKGEIVEGPEYESLSMLGANLGSAYLPFVIKSNRLCDELGIDTISAGAVVSFAMECYEKGLLRREDLNGLELTFGNHDAALQLMEDIAYRRGAGDWLAEGVRRAAERVGQGSEAFAMHVKGMEFPGYDPRAAFGAGLTYAVTPRGACHRRAWPPALEVLGDYYPFTTEGKAEIVKGLFNENCIFHSLLICDFPGKFVPLDITDYADYLTMITGERFTAGDLQQMAERVETLMRLFNNREGFTRDDDTLPGRIFDDPSPDGPPRGQRIDRQAFAQMLSEYYRLRGWDDRGVPTPDTLARLGL